MQIYSSKKDNKETVWLMAVKMLWVTKQEQLCGVWQHLTSQWLLLVSVQNLNQTSSVMSKTTSVLVCTIVL